MSGIRVTQVQWEQKMSMPEQEPILYRDTIAGGIGLDADAKLYASFYQVW